MSSAALLRTGLVALVALCGASSVYASAGSDGDIAQLIVLSRHNQKDALDKLDKLGPSTVPKIMDMISGRVVVANPAADGPLMTSQSRTLLISVASLWNRKAVLRELNRWVTNESSLTERIAAVEFAGTLAFPEDLPSIAELLEGIDEADLQHSFVQRALESTLAQMLERHNKQYVEFVRAARDVRDGMLPALITAVTRAGDPEGVQVLTLVLERAPGLAESVLDAIGRWPVRSTAHVNEECIALVTRFLTSADVSVQRSALVAIGRLQGTQLFGDVLDYLSSDDSGVQRSALWSLQQLAGLNWADDIERWNHYYDSESDWYQDEAPALLRALERRDGGAVDALRQLSTHRIWRHELTSAIAPLIESDQDQVASAAVAALARLDSFKAIEPLVASLEQSRSSLRLAALSSLQIMTHESFGTDAGAWRAWLEN